MHDPDGFADLFRRPEEDPPAVAADPAPTPPAPPYRIRIALDDLPGSELRERWPELAHAAAAGWIDLR